MNKMGLVLQGGGALGAYEYGAVTRLIELQWQPAVVTGVSIGAINAAAVAGARNGDIRTSLERIWDAITLPQIPFWPADQQAVLSLWGNPRFYRVRTDVFNPLSQTNVYDLSPLRETLATICDFDQLNDSSHVRISVTATDVTTGGQVSFSNYVASAGAHLRVIPKVRKGRITPEHILASASLPPGFPMTDIGDMRCWDGGLFDNTPIWALLDLLDEAEIDNLPIFVIELFPTRDSIPHNQKEVIERMIEISYENRFWAEYEGAEGLSAFTDMLAAVARDLPANSAVRSMEPFHRLQRLRALKNLKVVPAAHVPMSGALDFSVHSVKARFDAGYAAIDKSLDTLS
ncbi:MAG: patatin-like phospholipase family protein [Deltaproteobacteria bacterium]|nr:patatin-like phospholipase family protein [Deltaproteobacteria bacterium]MBV8453811.1 patatin-like phospholipase family protein [Deltaproteobacteria bacterium]